jgi:dsDNA-binding SOS-regulon protein
MLHTINKSAVDIHLQYNNVTEEDARASLLAHAEKLKEVLNNLKPSEENLKVELLARLHAITWY